MGDSIQISPSFRGNTATLIIGLLPVQSVFVSIDSRNFYGNHFRRSKVQRFEGLFIDLAGTSLRELTSPSRTDFPFAAHESGRAEKRTDFENPLFMSQPRHPGAIRKRFWFETNMEFSLAPIHNRRLKRI
jgi:hypothetical protein